MPAESDEPRTLRRRTVDPVRVRTGFTLAAAGLVAGLLTTVDTAGASSDPVERVVTLGDSYSSGLGIHADASDYDDHGPPTHSFAADTRLGGSTCHRELDTSAGAQLAAPLRAESIVAACAGATITDVANQLAAADIQGSGSGTLVQLTIGGNDLRTRGGDAWTGVLIDCILSSRCDRVDANQPVNVGAIRRDATELLASIGNDLGDATIRVVGYPRLMQPQRFGCPGVTGIGRSEAEWIDDRVDDLNAALASAAVLSRLATGADIRYVSVVDEFDGHGSCRVWQRDRYVNDAVFGETYTRRAGPDGSVDERFADGTFTVSAASFHPSQAGYDAFTRAITASL